MDINFITGAILLSLSGVLAYSLKSIPNFIYERIRAKLIYSVKIYEMDGLFAMLENYLRENHTNEYNRVEAYTTDRREHSDNNMSKPDKRFTSIFYRQEVALFTIKFNDKRLLVDKNKEKLEHGKSLKDLYYEHYEISGFRAKKQINAFLEECVKLYKSTRMDNSIMVSTNSRWGDWMRHNEIVSKSISQVILPQELKRDLIDDLDLFISSEKWYVSRSIPYKRGYFFYGPPGTGKTSISMAIAGYLMRNVHMLNINTLEDDSSLIKSFSELTNNSIMFIEDIDKSFDKRESKSKCTFSALLNCLDGALYKHNCIVIITTNHPELLDPALIRNGRMDFKAKIDYPTQQLIEDYIKMFYSINAVPEFQIPTIGTITMSTVQEICMKNRNDYTNCIKELETHKHTEI